MCKRSVFVCVRYVCVVCVRERNTEREVSVRSERVRKRQRELRRDKTENTEVNETGPRIIVETTIRSFFLWITQHSLRGGSHRWLWSQSTVQKKRGSR